MEARSLADLLEEHEGAGRPYLEFLRSESMSVGLYVLPAAGVDEQLPHREDEVYVVIHGRGRFTADGQTRDVAPGDVIFVAAGVDHRFHEIAEELQLVVLFAPPESS